MVLNQQPAQWTYGGRKLEYVGNVGSTGGSTGNHLHGELRDSSGKNPKDWTNTEAASNVFFQKPDGSIGRLYEPTENGGFRLNPAAVKTSPFGMRNHPISGGSKMHTGNDYGLAGGTKLFVPWDILAGSFAGFNDPNGYGNAVDIPTKYGTLRFGHLQNPANKLTIDPTGTAPSTDAGQVAATPVSAAAQAQPDSKSTTINLAIDLSEKTKEKAKTFLDDFRAALLQSVTELPDYGKIIAGSQNLYPTIG